MYKWGFMKTYVDATSYFLKVYDGGTTEYTERDAEEDKMLNCFTSTRMKRLSSTMSIHAKRRNDKFNISRGRFRLSP